MPHHRRQTLLICLAIFVTVSATSPVTAQPGETRPDSNRRVFRERTDAATSLATPTDDAKRGISLTLWTLTLSESAGPEADELEAALRDKAKNLAAVVGTSDDVRELVGKLKVAGLLKKFREIRLMTVDGQVVTAQSGADEPSIVGATFNDFGVTSSVQYRQIGTIVRTVPRVDADGFIQVGLEYSSSHIEKSDTVKLAEPTKGNPIVADVIVSKQVSTIVRVKSGSAVVVSGDAVMDFSIEEPNGDVLSITESGRELVVSGDATKDSKQQKLGGETQLIILAAEIAD